MALNAALKQLIETKLAHTHEPQWALPIAEVRQAFRNLWTPAITGELVSIRRIEDMMIPGVDTPIPTRVYVPDGAQPCPLMLYFHGGGYVKGGIEESDAFCRNLAHVTRHMVLSIDYRLAPEHPFPAALDDAVAATIWAGTHAIDCGGAPGPMVVCGESAGGNLAAVTCLRLRSNPHIAIRYQILLQPYRSDQCDPRDPRVSPIYAEDLSGLPPALIIAAEYDTLRDEAEAYAARLITAGVATRYTCADGMVHGFLQMRGIVPDAQIATEEIARALN